MSGLSAEAIIQNSSDEIDIEHENWKAKRREALDADSKWPLEARAEPTQYLNEKGRRKHAERNKIVRRVARLNTTHERRTYDREVQRTASLSGQAIKRPTSTYRKLGT